MSRSEELKVLEPDELEGRLKTSRRELYELRFKLAVGQLDDHRQIRKVRLDIARLLTFKRQRELGLLVLDETTAPAPAAEGSAPTAEPAAANPAKPAAKPRKVTAPADKVGDGEEAE